MNRELTKKLCEKFPLIYRGRTQPITQNLMAFGFECGDGWYDLLYNLSEKLETITKDLSKNDKDSHCANCSCLKSEHYACGTPKPGKCLLVKKISTKRVFRVFRAKYLWQRPFMWTASKIYRMLEYCKKLFFYKLQVCWCEAFDPTLPLAVQVKEKYGTLRFYMHYSTEEMEDLINEAENVSAKTCETCGQSGVLRGPGWYFTACDTHAVNTSGEFVTPVGNDEP